jgi:hypothetical protein
MFSKILSWPQEHIKRWTKPTTLPLILRLLSDLTRNCVELMIENQFRINWVTGSH